MPIEHTRAVSIPSLGFLVLRLHRTETPRVRRPVSIPSLGFLVLRHRVLVSERGKPPYRFNPFSGFSSSETVPYPSSALSKISVSIPSLGFLVLRRCRTLRRCIRLSRFNPFSGFSSSETVCSISAAGDCPIVSIPSLGFLVLRPNVVFDEHAARELVSIPSLGFLVLRLDLDAVVVRRDEVSIPSLGFLVLRPERRRDYAAPRTRFNPFSGFSSSETSRLYAARDGVWFQSLLWVF